MLLYHSSCFENHDTRQHPECVRRITQVNRMLRDSGWIERSTCPDWTSATLEQCSANHSREYLRSLQDWCRFNAGRIEVDTIVSNGSWDAALMGAGAVCDAVDRIQRGEDRNAFCAIRPPGHHALPNSAMGFCLINNVSVGALHARSVGFDKVLIVDWDVHHGNGTQATFWEDPNVGFVSIHRFPFYPGTGNEEETGSGDGLGNTVNIPVPASIRPIEFLDRLKRAVERHADRLKPDIIFLSAGFDAHREDPVGGLTLDHEHFESASQWLQSLAEHHCGGRLIALLEGGYHLDRLPESVDAHLRGMMSPS